MIVWEKYLLTLSVSRVLQPFCLVDLMAIVDSDSTLEHVCIALKISKLSFVVVGHTDYVPKSVR